MHTKAIFIEGIRPSHSELKNQRPCTAVSALLGLIRMVQLADELCNPT